LDAFASGRRQSGIMQPVAAALGEGERQRLASHFAALDATAPVADAELDATAPVADAELDATAPVADAEVDAGSVERGRRLAFQGAGMRRIPACVECHGPDRSERNRMYPDIAGQHPDYLALQLRLFARGGRGGTRYAHLMVRAAAGLEPGEIRDLAAYYASLPPGS